MTEIRFATKIEVINERVLREWANDLDNAGNVSIENAVYAAVVNPEDAPLDAGFEIKSGLVTNLKDAVFEVNLLVEVLDAEKFVRNAISRYVACWQDDDWRPKTLCEAGYEILIASNASPSPLDVGFEIHDTNYLVNTVIPNTGSTDEIGLDERFYI